MEAENVAIESNRKLAESIRKCSISLRSLVLRNGWEQRNLSYLIDNGDGNYVAYPNLEIIKIYMDALIENFEFSITPFCTVPFPNLKALCVHGAYPFLDDTLFRGNQHSLQYLQMDVTSKIVDIFRGSKLFTDGNIYKKLDYVNVNVNVVFSKETDSQVVRMISDMAQCARVLELRNNGFTRRCHMKKPRCQFSQGLELLRVLRVQYISMDMEDVMDLLSALPQLYTLGCNLLYLCERSDILSSTQLLKSLETKYATVKSELRCLELLDHGQFSSKFVAQAILILSILCPKLKVVKVRSSQTRISLDSSIKTLLKLMDYKGHRDRLEPLDIMSVD